MDWKPEDLRKCLAMMRKSSDDARPVKSDGEVLRTYDVRGAFTDLANINNGPPLEWGERSNLGERLKMEASINNIVYPVPDEELDEHDDMYEIDLQLRNMLKDDRSRFGAVERVLIHDARADRNVPVMVIPSLLLHVDTVDVCCPDAGAVKSITDPDRKFCGKGRSILPSAFNTPGVVNYSYDLVIIETPNLVAKLSQYKRTGHVTRKTIVYGSRNGSWERYDALFGDDEEEVPPGSVELNFKLDVVLEEISLTSQDFQDSYDEIVAQAEADAMADMERWNVEHMQLGLPEALPIDRRPVKVDYMESVNDTHEAIRDGGMDTEYEERLTLAVVEQGKLSDLVERAHSSRECDELYYAPNYALRVAEVESSVLSAIPLSPGDVQWEPVPPDDMRPPIVLPVRGRFQTIYELGGNMGPNILWSQIPYGRQGVVETHGSNAYLFLSFGGPGEIDSPQRTFICRYRVRLRSDSDFLRIRCILSAQDGFVYLYELLDSPMARDRTDFISRVRLLESAREDYFMWDFLKVVKWHERIENVMTDNYTSSIVGTSYYRPRGNLDHKYAVIPPSGYGRKCEHPFVSPANVAFQWGIWGKKLSRLRNLVDKCALMVGLTYDLGNGLENYRREDLVPLCIAYLRFYWYESPRRRTKWFGAKRYLPTSETRSERGVKVRRK